MGRHMHFVEPSLYCGVLNAALTCVSFVSSSLFSFSMVDDLSRLVKAAQIATPFILVGSELGALNARFYTHIFDE